MINKILIALFKVILDFLRGLKNTKHREGVANLMLSYALKAKGYGNYLSYSDSGEQYFLDIALKKINPKVCVDVGANIGEYTQALLKSTDALVIAFEPLDEPFKVLIDLKNEYKERFIAENKGVGAKNETLDIYYDAENTACASFSTEVQHVPYLRNKLSKKIEMVSLDSYFLEESDYVIDFLKIDTEGFEYEVLLGAKKTIKTHKPKAIQIEFNWHHLFRGHTLFLFSELLEGYTPFQMVPNDLVKRDPKDPYSNIYIFSNFVFIRNDYL